MTGLVVEVLGVGLHAPGLPDWPTGRERLASPGTWQDQSPPPPLPQRLAPAERRRAGAPVKVSLVVADEAVLAAGVAPAGLATVFTSSSGDTQNCHVLCETLASAERLVSPTRFTNSVHNAAAGYWHIATASRAPSTSLCAFDASFGAGLLEAATQAVALARPVLLVAADVPYPEPLHAKRPLPASVGVALVIAPPGGDDARPAARPRLTISLRPAAGEAPTPCDGTGLESLRAAVPAARALPLLQALARGGRTDLAIEAQPGLSLAIEVRAAAEVAST